MSVTLGLDLGPNSVGWALINDNDDNITDAGVRVFPEGVDNFDSGKEQSRNEQRRMARAMRRQLRRRAYRKRLLRQALIEVGLFPSDRSQQETLFQQDPYAIRAKALDQKISTHEIGRLLLHLNQRRGFLSNRKKDRADKEVKGMLAEISDLAADMEKTEARTLGEYLHHKGQSLSHASRIENDHVRNRHTRRAMLEEEFEAIWQAQQQYYPDLLTDELRYGQLDKQKFPRKPIPKHHPERKGLSDLQAFGLYGLIFFQRPMYWPKSVVGLCELEPRQKRCPRAHRVAQEFRLLQEINNLSFIDPDQHIECRLSNEQREMLLDFLKTRAKATFDDIRKKIGFSESVRFNLEKGKRPYLQGMVTDWTIAKEIGKEWHKRPEEQKTKIVELLLKNELDEDTVIDRLISEYGFDQESAEKLVGFNLPDGYANLSIVALNKLLPHMRRGLSYMATDESNSALHAAGYMRPDQLQRRIFDRLPDPRRTKDCPIGDIPNPVVKRTLFELRKVVNSIIREYGKPDAVHVEMARSVQMGRERRSQYNKQIRERQAARDHAADEVRKLGIKVTRDAILRFLLWQEQNLECIYCGKTISLTQLFGGEVDIDHILPYSLSLDNSQANKVICHRKCNTEKGQKTPYEWLAATNPEAYSRLCTQAQSLVRKGLMPYGKYRRFLRKDAKLDEFITRQLVDTGYIASATVEYLQCLFEHTHTVLGLKGQYTSELRHQWGLDEILAELPDSPAWQEQNQLRPGEKNRADHRHHALDAIIVALTNRSRLQQLAKLRRFGLVDRQTGEVFELPEPWSDFRKHVSQKLEQIKVSHRANRGISGALHEDTFYGPVKDSSGNVLAGKYVVRKPIDSLSLNEVSKIRDHAIRRLVEDRLAEKGITAGRAKKADPKLLKEALSGLTMKSGVPIKKVRIIRNEQTIRPIRVGKPGQAYVKPGNTHHLCIFQWNSNAKPKWGAVFVAMAEAIDRLRGKEQIIQRTPPIDHPTIPLDARFVMSLSQGEMVLADYKGQEKLLAYKTGASTQGQQLLFAEHIDARRSSDQKTCSFNANTLIASNARKVTIDPLGRIRWAND